MLVILNSDVLFTNEFVHQRLHRNWREFAEGCRDANAAIVFPSTALYEVDLRQQELYKEQIGAIGRASNLLIKKYGMKFEAPNPQDLLKAPDIVQLFKATGVAVRIEHATLADFQDAERRAETGRLWLDIRVMFPRLQLRNAHHTGGCVIRIKYELLLF